MWSSTGVAQADEGEAAIAEIWDRLPAEAQSALEGATSDEMIAAAAAEDAAAQAQEDAEDAARGQERAQERMVRDAENAQQLADMLAYQAAVTAEALALHEAAVAAGANSPRNTVAPEGDQFAAAPVAVAEPSYTSSSCCDKGQLVQLAADVGFPDPNLAAAIAMGESSGDPHARGDGGQSFGLWQIHWPAHYNKGFSQDDLLTPTGNAAAAKAVYDEVGGFNPWTVYKTGAYRQYL